MKAVNRCIAGLLALFIMGLYIPEKASCTGSPIFAKGDEKPITQHEPKVMAVEEKEIPKVKVAEKKKGVNKYIWIGLGTLLVGGVVAALASGGSSDNDDKDSGEFRTKW